MRIGIGRCLATAAAAALLTPLAAGAAPETTVQLTGDDGVLTENPNPARLNQLPVLGFGQGLSVPYDPATGLATGARKFRPIVIAVGAGKPTPKLVKAAATNGPLQAIIRFYQNAGDATESLRITLTNARVVNLLFSGSPGPDLLTENVTLSFSQAEWTHLPSGETHIENWAAGP